MSVQIWVVWVTNFQSEDEYCGAFSSEANAKLYIEKFCEFDRSAMRIEQAALDDAL